MCSRVLSIGLFWLQALLLATTPSMVTEVVVTIFPSLVVTLYNLFAVALTYTRGVVVVAQLAKRSIPTPEVRSLNPVIGEVFTEHC